MEYYFEPLGISATFSRALEIFRKQWSVFILISTIAVVLSVLVNLAIVFGLGPLLGYTQVSMDSGGVHVTYSQLSPVVWIIFFAQAALYYAIMCIADGAIIQAVAEIYIGRIPTLSDVIKKGIARLYALFIACALIDLVMAALSIIFIALLFSLGEARSPSVLMVGLALLWAMGVVVTYHVYPSIMVENSGPIESIKRSWELSKDQRLYILCVVLIVFVLQMIVKLILDLMTQSYSTATIIIGQVLAFVFLILFASFGSILQAIVYFNVRSIKEDLDMEILDQQLGLDGVESHYNSF